MKLFVSPHNDDAALFGSFRIQEQKPLVLTVYDSHVQPSRGHSSCDAATRRKEDLEAMNILGVGLALAGVPDTEPTLTARPRILAGALALEPDGRLAAGSLSKS